VGVLWYARAHLIPHPPTAISRSFASPACSESSILITLPSSPPFYLSPSPSSTFLFASAHCLPETNPPWACLEFGSGGLVRNWRCNAQPSVVVERPATECLCEIQHPPTMADIEAARSSPITAEASLKVTQPPIARLLYHHSADLLLPRRHITIPSVASVDSL
jgi:hypothetical protein